MGKVTAESFDEKHAVSMEEAEMVTHDARRPEAWSSLIFLKCLITPSASPSNRLGNGTAADGDVANVERPRNELTSGAWRC